ncbi:MAG: hypothetical protein AOA65_1686 [Candidatus Bathyarchaeota archaeon BA1]|nr:MAG: hypothetical protein AOA65_1686 [Candidatus Bathyarchaeota archaeon BA1]
MRKRNLVRHRRHSSLPRQAKSDTEAMLRAQGRFNVLLTNAKILEKKSVMEPYGILSQQEECGSHTLDHYQHGTSTTRMDMQPPSECSNEGHHPNNSPTP